MKSPLLPAFFLLAASVVFSCKKKDKDAAPAPPPVVPVQVNVFTATVNGIAWSMAPIDGYFMGKYGSMHEFGGMNSVTPPWTIIALHFTCAPGSYTLNSTLPFSANFGTSSGTVFTSRSGSLTITQIDTFPNTDQQFVKKLKCTFNFMTDTIGGQSYNVTDGQVDFTKPQ